MKPIRMPSVVAIISGALTGVALRLCAGSGNGFEMGPGIFAATILLTLGAAISALLIAVGRRHRRVVSVLCFCIATLVTDYVLVVVWPFREPPGPVPLEQLDRENRQ